MNIETDKLSITQLEALAKQMLAYVLKVKNPAMSGSQINKKVKHVTGNGLDSSVMPKVLESAQNGEEFKYETKPLRKTSKPLPAPVAQVPVIKPVVTPPVAVQPVQPRVAATTTAQHHNQKLPNPNSSTWVDVNGNRLWAGDFVKVPTLPYEHRIVTCKLSKQDHMFGEPIVKLSNGKWVSTKGLIRLDSKV